MSATVSGPKAARSVKVPAAGPVMRGMDGEATRLALELGTATLYADAHAAFRPWPCRQLLQTSAAHSRSAQQEVERMLVKLPRAGRHRARTRQGGRSVVHHLDASRPRARRPGTPTPLTAGEACEQHGAALFSLACALLGDRSAAETAVVDVIADTCAQPGAIDFRGSTRHQLAQLVYLRCTGPYVDRSGAVLGPESLGASRRRRGAYMAGLGALSQHQRAAIVLVLFGGHRYREVSALLGLPAPAVAGLLLTGLREVRQ